MTDADVAPASATAAITRSRSSSPSVSIGSTGAISTWQGRPAARIPRTSSRPRPR